MRGMVVRLATFGGLLLLAPIVVAASESDAVPEAPFRFVLTSARTNLRTETFSVGDRDFPGIKTAPWSVRKTILHGGKQEGVELITVDTGTMTICVTPTRGMGLLEVRSGDLRLGWTSPVKEVVHPQFVDLESRGGLGWLEGFNEMLVRCGLEFAGHPGRDEFVDNTGAKAEMQLTLHGKIGNIPASEVEVVVDRAAPHRIRVRGIVHERSFFGPKLELATEVSTVPGTRTFRVEDSVTNHGAAAQEFQLIYHANFGAPLLEKGARVFAPVERITPMNDHAATSIDDYATYEGPIPGFIEQVYLVSPLADARGRTGVVLRNAAKDRGVSMFWSIRDLPYLTIWKNTAAVEDGYVTGLEPATGFPFNRKVERQFGRVPRLSPGETRKFSIEFGLLPDATAVEKATGRIAEIRNGREPAVDSRPTPVDH